MKKAFSFILCLLLVLTFLPPLSGTFLAAPDTILNSYAAHSNYRNTTDSPYSSDAYLYDTLTLAGSGMTEGIQTFTLLDIQNMAFNSSTFSFGYENTYSLMTSGGSRSFPLFTGILLYDFLLFAGLNETLPDSTPIKFISKDGYTISLTLGKIRSVNYSRFTSADNDSPEETGLPAIIAFGCNGFPLVGPTADDPLTRKFTEADGYIEAIDNSGGPLRLILGQTEADIFNAPDCAKWLSAIVIGDPEGYVYTRNTSATDSGAEPSQDGDWTHGAGYEDYTLTISGSEAIATSVLTLYELESLSEGIVRENFACSSGKNAYEGVVLRYLITQYMAEGISRPSKVTVISSDGYSKEVDVNDIFSGIESSYQPGKHKDIILAFAIDAAPLVSGTESDSYNGSNGSGPLRLVVENTVSAWVKSVDHIVIGEDNSSSLSDPAPFSDLDSCPWAAGAIAALYKAAVVTPTDGTLFSPEKLITRHDFNLMLVRAFDCDVPADSTENAPDNALTRQEAMVLIYNALIQTGASLPENNTLDAFSDASDINPDALESVRALTAAGIINGIAGQIRPSDYITRSQIATALYRAMLYGGFEL